MLYIIYIFGYLYTPVIPALDIIIRSLCVSVFYYVPFKNCSPRVFEATSTTITTNQFCISVLSVTKCYLIYWNMKPNYLHLLAYTSY